MHRIKGLALRVRDQTARPRDAAGTPWMEKRDPVAASQAATG
jgi:hypothetical protein